jgi:hypothetical protein
MYALRGKGKIKTDKGIREAYKIYKEEGGILKYSLFSKIIREANDSIIDLIIKESLEFNMPRRIGTLRIRKFPTKTVDKNGNSIYKRRRPDWAKTKKLWAEKYPGKTMEELKQIPDKPLVRHLNEHSNQYAYTFHYNKNLGKYKNKSTYSFTPARGAKNLLAATIKDPNIRVDYYE